MSLPQTGLEQRLDLRLGQMAVRKGRITHAQLQQALEEQLRGVQRGRKKPRRLGVILAEMKLLTFEEVRALLEEQEARILAEDRRRREDGLLGRILIDAALAEAAHVEECLRLQTRSVEDGAEKAPLLGELLVQKGYATAADVEQALELQKKVRLACASCHKEFGIDRLPVEKMDQCPECGGLLEALPPEPEPEPEPPPPEPEPEPAEDLRTLGRYRDLRRIGQGAIGAVYEALDPQLNRKVALKVLRSDLESAAGADDREVKRFIREAQLSANLPKHPNIVAVYEAGAQDGRHFIAMEFIAGKTLGEWRKKGGVPVRKQVRVIRDVALAVHHAHDHGVLHRDLKPGNILIDATGRPFVVDFGLARPVDPDSSDASGTHRVCGTPSYMAPEQARGDDLDARCDVFALGAMLYEILTGRPPFTGRNRQEVLQKLLSNAAPAPPGSGARSRPFSSVDPAIEKICLKALDRNLGERTPSARALAKELTAWLDSADKAKAGETVAGAPKWRRPTLLAAGAAGFFLTLFLVLPLLGKKTPSFEKDLQQAATHAEAGRTQTALDFYEEILRRDPKNAKARQGRDEMRRRRVTEAAKGVDEAYSGLERAKAEADQKAKALQKATVGDERRLRDETQAAQEHVRDAEEQLRKARELLKSLAETSEPAAPKDRP